MHTDLPYMMVCKQRVGAILFDEKSGNRISIPGLTGVRGFAAIWVVLYHLHMISDNFGLAGMLDNFIVDVGWVGVDLFFVLSGFVLMLSHEHQFRSLEYDRLISFYRLRFFRVYPLATAVLAIILVMVIVQPDMTVWYRAAHSPEDFTVKAFIKTLFLATRWIPGNRGDWNGPTWSLSAEIIGYVVFPLLAFVLSHLRSSLLCLIALAGFLIVPPLVFQFKGTLSENNIAGIIAVTRMAGFFAAGATLQRLWATGPLPDEWASPLLVVLSLMFIGSAIWLNIPYALPLAFVILIYAIACRSPLSELIFANKIAMQAGRYSFALYLCHMPILILAGYEASLVEGSSRILIFAGALIAIALLTWLLATFVEKPVHDWARRQQRKIMSPVTAATSP